MPNRQHVWQQGCEDKTDFVGTVEKGAAGC